jgi:hypothetical protein
LVLKQRANRQAGSRRDQNRPNRPQ